MTRTYLHIPPTLYFYVIKMSQIYRCYCITFHFIFLSSILMSRQLLDYSVAITTPFTENGDFDSDAVPTMIQYYVKQLKFPGLLISGSTGEQHCLSIEERKQLFQLVKNNVPSGYPVYAGVAAFKTKDAIDLAQAAEKIGLSGIMLGLPPYRIPSQIELEKYVTDAASATQLPIFVYNNPRRNGCFVDPTTFQRIAEANSNVVGIKEAGDPEFVPQIKSCLKDSTAYSFFTGSDLNFLEEYKTFGYTGITSIFANIFPRQIEDLVKCVFEDNMQEAEIILKELTPTIELISRAGVLQCIKYILRERGLPAGYCPPPLSAEPSDEVKLLLKELV